MVEALEAGQIELSNLNVGAGAPVHLQQMLLLSLCQHDEHKEEEARLELVVLLQIAAVLASACPAAAVAKPAAPLHLHCVRIVPKEEQAGEGAQEAAQQLTWSDHALPGPDVANEQKAWPGSWPLPVGAGSDCSARAQVDKGVQGEPQHIDAWVVEPSQVAASSLW